MTSPIAVTDSSFDTDVITSPAPVLVDFWGPGCAPCKALEPTLAALAEEYAGQVVIAKVNVADNPRVASMYNVRSLPTLMMFKQDEICSTAVGSTTRAALTAMIEEALR